MARLLLGLALFLCSNLAAFSHDLWINGEPVPAWIKNSCCGPADAHHLLSSQVHALRDGWHIDGYPFTLSYGRELPSQDGDFWVFYATLEAGGVSPVYCFFAPVQTW
jgi:hypothetical protein